jgi:hypothetical protein
MEKRKRVYRIKGEVVSRRIAGEDLLIPIRGRLADMQRIFALDPVAAHIWSGMDGARDLDGILKSILETFEVTEDRARSDLDAFVSQLEGFGLLESCPQGGLS